METTMDLASVSLPLLALGGALVLLVVLLFMLKIKKAKRSTGEQKSPIEEKGTTTLESSSKSAALKEPLHAEPKEEIESPQTQTKLPVHTEPVTETHGVTRKSFERFEGRRVLIVDDNALNIKLIVKLMDGSGLKLDTASDGLEALKTLRGSDHRYDLVLMDINMPKMDGLECTRQIRSDLHLKDIPVVALTGSTSKEDVEKILESGMNAYLNKPIVLGKLYSVFLSFFNGKEKQ